MLFNMEKTLYMLGAGFSAPLGVPVISNFLSKSKDMLQNESGKYAHFASIKSVLHWKQNGSCVKWRGWGSNGF